MFAKFHSHLRGGTQITRVLGIPGGDPGIPKTRQPYLEGIPISLGIWVWGYPNHCDSAIFTEPGSGGEWDDRLGRGNPVSHPSTKNYLRSIKEEQAQARVCPKKSIPLFLDKSQRLAEHIVCKLRAPEISPICLYLLSRDLCFFSVDFFSGDRSSDLGRVLSREVLFFPQSSGILFNHTFGKTLRGDSVNTFAVKRCDNQVVCPVRNFERYLSISKLLRIDLSKGCLFRATKGNSVLADPFVGSAV